MLYTDTRPEVAGFQEDYYCNIPVSATPVAANPKVHPSNQRKAAGEHAAEGRRILRPKRLVFLLFIPMETELFIVDLLVLLCKSL